MDNFAFRDPSVPRYRRKSWDLQARALAFATDRAKNTGRRNARADSTESFCITLLRAEERKHPSQRLNVHTDRRFSRKSPKNYSSHGDSCWRTAHFSLLEKLSNELSICLFLFANCTRRDLNLQNLQSVSKIVFGLLIIVRKMFIAFKRMFNGFMRT